MTPTKVFNKINRILDISASATDTNCIKKIGIKGETYARYLETPFMYFLLTKEYANSAINNATIIY